MTLWDCRDVFFGNDGADQVVTILDLCSARFVVNRQLPGCGGMQSRNPAGLAFRNNNISAYGKNAYAHTTYDAIRTRKTSVNLLMQFLQS
jgi:hypothetical protein